MLYGRGEERALLARLLERACDGHGGVLVIHGDAGVGTSTLLRDAAEHSSSMRVLHASGVESEVELPFATLHQLLQPVLDRLDRLPAPQARALRGAFGLADIQPNRFLIELGILNLLAEVAKERPLLCLVDDAQRLDRASADTVVFVARRLESERIALLVAARDDNVREFLAPGLPELHLGGLDDDAAVQLLEAQPGKIALDVRDRLIGETRGNPLALLELPATLSSEQLAGREPMPEWLPLGTTLQRAFLWRLRRLPPLTQRLLLVAAAEETGEVATVLAAAQRLAIGPEALEPAEHAGLVQVTESTLRFRHPLVRSAIYQDATFTARRSVHRALTEVLQGDQDADRRAWHLAAATIGPDEQVASTLERSADRARRRGGPGSAAAALERAASLTPQVGPRARRLAAAAEHLWEAGHSERALSVLDQVPPLAMDVAVRARSAHVRGAIELATGTPAAAYTVLARGAEPILESDPERAREMLALAAWAALAANDLDRVVGELSPAMFRVPGQDDLRIKRVAESLIASELVHAPPIAAGLDGTREATTWPHPAFTWMWPMLMLVEPVADEVTADQHYGRLAAARRHAGTVSTLTVALANLALVEASIGKWPTAVSNATEGLRLARDTGQPAMAGYFLAMLAAIAAEQGRADDCRRLADEALSIALPRRLAVVAAFASWTLALLDLTGGRAHAALDRLRALATPQDLTAHAGIALLATGTLVEAAARSGALEGMEPVVARFERWAQLDRRPWTLLVARRSRALIGSGDDAERHFRAALAVGGIGEMPFELARTELLYGEWLRRARRRSDARTHLRTSLEIFERLGAMSFVDRARGELRASGETARKRELGTREQLTAQELQIARLARQGLRNREIAARLFLSPHTVGYHLHKIYAKLGIVSRAGLRQLDLDNDLR